MTSAVYASTTWFPGTDTDVAEAVVAMVDLGLDGIEVGSTHRYQSWPEMRDRLRAAWAGAMVTHNYFPPAQSSMVVNLASDDPAVRDASIAHARHCLACTEELGATVYTVHPGFLAAAQAATGNATGPYDFSFAASRSAREPAFDRMLAALEDLATEAARRGVRLAVETEGTLTAHGVLLLEQPEEYDRLFAALGDGIWLNFNLAHSTLASRHHGFGLGDFIARWGHRFALCELSHNDRARDLHRPLVADSWVLDWIPRLPAGVPLILEFRDAERSELAESIRLVRARQAQAQQAQA